MYKNENKTNGKKTSTTTMTTKTKCPNKVKWSKNAFKSVLYNEVVMSSNSNNTFNLKCDFAVVIRLWWGHGVIDH